MRIRVHEHVKGLHSMLLLLRKAKQDLTSWSPGRLLAYTPVVQVSATLLRLLPSHKKASHLIHLNRQVLWALLDYKQIPRYYSDRFFLK